MKALLRDKANFDILEGFLSELLKQDILIEEILESEGNQEDAKDKFNRVDLLTRLKEGPHLIVELQFDQQLDYLSRILYGSCKLITEQMQLGKPYAKVKKVISISILYFDLGQGDDYIYHGTTQYRGVHTGKLLELQPEEQEAYCKETKLPVERVEEIYPEYYLLEVNRFPQVVKDRFDEWMYFLRNEKIEPHFTAKGLDAAGKKLRLLKLSPQQRREYQAYWERMSQESSMILSHYGRGKSEGRKEGLIEGRKEGEQVGMAKGREEANRELARRLLQKGMMSLDEVAEITRLVLEEVRRIERELR